MREPLIQNRNMIHCVCVRACVYAYAPVSAPRLAAIRVMSEKADVMRRRLPVL